MKQVRVSFERFLYFVPLETLFSFMERLGGPNPIVNRDECTRWENYSVLGRQMDGKRHTIVEGNSE